ncbi:TPA: hypothetical protein PMC50_003461 [Vibrio cholerae]|nr:hypothetical protein [Vibrio cholerae]
MRFSVLVIANEEVMPEGEEIRQRFQSEMATPVTWDDSEGLASISTGNRGSSYMPFMYQLCVYRFSVSDQVTLSDLEHVIGLLQSEVPTVRNSSGVEFGFLLDYKLDQSGY